MLRTQPDSEPLTEDGLRDALLAALNEEFGAKLLFQDDLFDKLQKHGVSDLDLLCVCRGWQKRRKPAWDGRAWRYKIEGENLDGKWMAVVLAVYLNPIIAIAITGFLFSRGRTRT